MAELWLCNNGPAFLACSDFMIAMQRILFVNPLLNPVKPVRALYSILEIATLKMVKQSLL